MSLSLRCNEAGKLLLEALTNEQTNEDAIGQWVSVEEDNQLGIPFYKSRGFQLQRRKENTLAIGETQVSLKFMRKLDHIDSVTD